MKVLIVQLSDMHCKTTDYRLTTKIDKLPSALKTLGSFENIILVFSGDLADIATSNEYKTAKTLLGRILKKLSDEFKCGFINTIIVPGNHDISLPEGCRGSSDILDWNKDEHLFSELNCMDNFFDYAISKNCFVSNRICDKKILQIKDIKMQFCLLNSAPYSTRKADDKELHYLPPYIREKMTRDHDIDIKITVMHHSYEWCDWNTKEMLKQSIVDDDIVFFGHDHKAESLTIVNGDGSDINIIMGGRFALKVDDESSFNAIIYDSETSQIERYEFDWHKSHSIFSKKHMGTISKKQKMLHPTEEYLDRLLEDKQQLTKRFTDYYILPDLDSEGDTFSENTLEYIGMDEIFNALLTEKVIEITGGNGAGKSSLLKYLYFESINKGFKPLFIEKRDYRDSRIDKMIQDMFELQYGTDEKLDYDFYSQTDTSSRIIFVDDFDLISNQRARENLFSYITSNGILLIYTTKEKKQDLEIYVKDKLQGKTMSTLAIKPFYKKTRDKLVTKIGALKYKTSEDVAPVVTALDYMVQCQANFFTLTPENLIQYIKYFINGGVGEGKGIKTITLVFETNIRNEMLANAGEEDALIYLSLLEFIANYLYFERKIEKISGSAELERIVSDFNSKRRAEVKAKDFLRTSINAHILKEFDDSFEISFCNKNTFAYFIAKSVNREIEKDPTNTNKILYIMNHICFGINDTIILFLSFIRSNTRIIWNIASKATELLEKYPEWDFDNNNIPFLSQPLSISDKTPTIQDKKEAEKKTEEIEKTRQETVSFRGIFDFREDDVEKEKYRVLRALKYVQLIGRTLVDQYGVLDSEELEIMTDILYSMPQKIIYAILQPYQKHSEEIINSILAFAKEKMPEERITSDDVRQMFAHAGVILALNVMNDIAYNSTNIKTIKVLREANLINTNYKIQALMMEENTGDTPTFISNAILLRDQCDSKPFAKMLIAQIARKHIMYCSNLDYRQVDRLISGKVLSSDSKKTALLEQVKKK